MAESEEELKTLFTKVKEKSEKAGLKLNIHKTRIMASSPITSGFPHSSVGKKKKKSTCNAGDPDLIPWRRDRLPTPVFLGFPCGSAG